MGKKVQHTPTPWEEYQGGNFFFIGGPGYIKYVDANSYCGGPLCVAEVEWKATKTHVENSALARANGKFILLACNNHDALVAALQEAVDVLSDSDWKGERRARAVLKKVYQQPRSESESI